MKLTTFGTRGSLSVSGAKHLRYGGCTTCVRVESEAIPTNSALAIDGGTGFLPLVQTATLEGKTDWFVLHTHYHLDHISGIAVALPIYDGASTLTILGPIDHGIGPKQAYERLINQPFHPVPFCTLENRIHAIGVEDPATVDLVFTAKDGLIQNSSSSNFDRSRPYLKITAFLASHPSRTLAFRFDEFPSKKCCVFMTDDEVRDPIPDDLIAFLSGADLLITDGQYSDLEYQSGSKRGWGHGTPKYAIELARLSGIRNVALTHHDPRSSDDDVDNLLAEATQVSEPLGITCSACSDGRVFLL